MSLKQRDFCHPGESVPVLLLGSSGYLRPPTGLSSRDGVLSLYFITLEPSSKHVALCKYTRQSKGEQLPLVPNRKLAISGNHNMEELPPPCRSIRCELNDPATANSESEHCGRRIIPSLRPTHATNSHTEVRSVIGVRKFNPTPLMYPPGKREPVYL
ncbi:hypothetical protein AVEN_167508-1 [Araneus ventricosus]|uniref:Uncharacterized protein n=1 Tax=Araneus ventricosus TaxID=182803 RepID=A0A4Y2ULI2_ARAVE|nr:hypothetical protein AVEN_167508-1 [Araneus ventricosus]